MTTVARRTASLGVVGLLALGMSIGVATPASAHNYLVSSTPAEGDVLTALPDEFVITTNDDLLNLGADAGGFALQVQDADGLFYGDGCVAVDGPSMTAVAALGAPGSYLLTWQVVSIDGHTVSGEIPFAWTPDDVTESSEGSATPPVCGEAAQQEPTPEPDVTEEPIAPAPEEAEAPAPSDLLWIGGAIAAVVIAAATTMLVLSRRKK
ncbi:copper resistance CopC family protein [Homoserinimonas sp. A520]